MLSNCKLLGPASLMQSGIYTSVISSLSLFSSENIEVCLAGIIRLNFSKKNPAVKPGCLVEWNFIVEL